MNRANFLSRIGREEIFLLNDYEEMAFRITEDPVEYFAKFKGEKEFGAKSDSKVLTDAILEQKELTKEEYNSF